MTTSTDTQDRTTVGASKLRIWLDKNREIWRTDKAFCESVEILRSQWSTIIRGSGYPDKKNNGNYAKLFITTGIVEFDPRQIPDKTVRVPSGTLIPSDRKMSGSEYRKFWNSWPGPLLKDGSRVPKALTADPDYAGPANTGVLKPQVEVPAQTHPDKSPSQSAQSLLMEIAAAALQGGVNVLAAQLATVLETNQTARDQRFAGSIAANLAPLLAANGRSEIVTALKKQSEELAAIRQLLQLTKEMKEIDQNLQVDSKERTPDQMARELYRALLEVAKGSAQESNAFAIRYHKSLVELLVLLEPFAVGGRDLEDKLLNLSQQGVI